MQHARPLEAVTCLLQQGQGRAAVEVCSAVRRCHCERPRRIQARKREDLDAMLQTLGLNAANPVSRAARACSVAQQR